MPCVNAVPPLPGRSRNQAGAGTWPEPPDALPDDKFDNKFDATRPGPERLPRPARPAIRWLGTLRERQEQQNSKSARQAVA